MSVAHVLYHQWCNVNIVFLSLLAFAALFAVGLVLFNVLGACKEALRCNSTAGFFSNLWGEGYGNILSFALTLIAMVLSIPIYFILRVVVSGRAGKEIATHRPSPLSEPVKEALAVSDISAISSDRPVENAVSTAKANRIDKSPSVAILLVLPTAGCALLFFVFSVVVYSVSNEHERNRIGDVKQSIVWFTGAGASIGALVGIAVTFQQLIERFPFARWWVRTIGIATLLAAICGGCTYIVSGGNIVWTCGAVCISALLGALLAQADLK